jgi:hypothetical protein
VQTAVRYPLRPNQGKSVRRLEHAYTSDLEPGLQQPNYDALRANQIQRVPCTPEGFSAGQASGAFATA